MTMLWRWQSDNFSVTQFLTQTCGVVRGALELRKRHQPGWGAGHGEGLLTAIIAAHSVFCILSSAFCIHFFNPACQFNTTVIGTVAACSAGVAIRNRPSLLTSKLGLMFPSRASNSACGTPA